MVAMSILFPNNPAYTIHGPGTCPGKLKWDPVPGKCVMGGPMYGFGAWKAAGGGLPAPVAAAIPAPSTSTNVLAGIQAPPEIRKWAYGGSVTAPKAQGPGIGIVLIGIGAVFLFMFTQKKRKKKR